MSDLILKSINRTPFQWIELDMPKCAHVYGAGGCSAQLGVSGEDKCYNTRATCQSPADYDGSETLTLSFCESRGFIPDDRYYFPYLDRVSVSAASLNLGGGNKNKSALGTMATLTASLSDHPHTDLIVDPYRADRAYDPFTRSTFWAKWRARNPYYMHRELRYYSGYIDPATGQVDPDTLIVRTFFVTGFSGFSAGGSVSLRAADIMTFVANDKAKAPKASAGKLLADLAIGATSFTLSPAGIGDLDYPASGKVRINKEIVSYTRAGDVMTITRSVANTQEAEHEAGDTVQLCLEFIGKKPNEILEVLLEDYAGIDAAYLDKTQWASEVTDYLPRLYSTLIASPTGVHQLVGEMAEQMYFTTVWNERTALLSIKSVRPADGEVITVLNDDQHVLEDSAVWSDEAEQLTTDVWVYYGQKNPAEKLNDGTNYAALDIVVDTESKGVDKNNTEKIRTIYSRWITEGGAAIDLGDRILARYREIPRSVRFSLDAKDGQLWLADFITLQNRHVVDASGKSLPVALQVISAQESVQGTTFTYMAQQYSGTSIGDAAGDIKLVISSDFVNLNLRQYYDDNIGSPPQAGDKITFTIRSGVTIGGCAFTDVENISDTISTSTDSSTTISMLAALSLYAGSYKNIVSSEVRNSTFSKTQRRGIGSAAVFNIGDTYTNPRVAAAYNTVLATTCQEYPLADSLRTGDWPEGVELYLEIQAGVKICGEAPISAIGYHIPSLNNIKANVYAGDGGHGLKISAPISIDNLGLIAGAGGAGSSFNLAMPGFGFMIAATGSGGGGQGYDYGQSVMHNGKIADYNFGPPSNQWKRFASRGTLLGAGYGSIFGDGTLAGQVAGNGGQFAQDGSNSNSFSGRNGLAGDAISEGANLITWINKGTVLGAENN